MEWDKLTIVFMSELVSQDDGSTNCQIASYILSNIEEVKKSNIKELAEKCHVSASSMSRFCKEVGLNDFHDLKMLLSDARFEFELVNNQSNRENKIISFIDQVKMSLDQVAGSLDPHMLHQLVTDIHRYKKVALFGLLKAETVAMNLQSDLMILGKQTTTKVSVSLQKEYINQATEDDLIIIFSYKGIYFDLTKALKGIDHKKPKIYVVTGNQEIARNRRINHVLSFSSNLDYISHPYQLQVVGSLIAQTYAELIKKKS